MITSGVGGSRRVIPHIPFGEISPTPSSSVFGAWAFRILTDLLAISSPTRDRDGVNRAQDVLQNHLEGLSFECHRIAHPEGAFGDLLVGRLAVGAPMTVTVLGHADTVLSAPECYRYEATSDRLVGPGVADDKGGLAVALAGLTGFLAEGTPAFNLQFVSSPSEELGSPGFTQALAQLGRGSRYILGFEPALENGDVITSRHGNRWYEIDVLGIEAHSGRAAGEEINAAHEAAIKIAQMATLPRQFPGTKLNIGALRSARDAFNVVCGRVHAKLDIRFPCRQSRDDLHARIVEIIETPHVFSADGTPSICRYAITDDCPPLERTETGRPLVAEHIRRLASVEGRPVRERHGCGASDVNYMCHPGAIAIDGLGPVGGGLHTEGEYILASTLGSRGFAVAALLESLNQEVRLNDTLMGVLRHDASEKILSP